MNLHAVVAPLISAVNPWLAATIRRSAGYATADDGTQIPAYTTSKVRAQVQALTYDDLRQIDGLNIQGERRAIYLDGSWDGVVRVDGRGGDLITLPDGSVWLVAQVLEDWSSTAGWVKVCATRQVT